MERLRPDYREQRGSIRGSPCSVLFAGIFRFLIFASRFSFGSLLLGFDRVFTRCTLLKTLAEFLQSVELLVDLFQALYVLLAQFLDLFGGFLGGLCVAFRLGTSVLVQRSVMGSKELLCAVMNVFVAAFTPSTMSRNVSAPD